MEKLKTRNEYVGCNYKCRFFADKCEAYSYGHWCFVKKINGKIIFNDYDYSVTTSRHQWAIKNLLKHLGIKIDTYVYMRESLDEYSFKYNSLKCYYSSAIQKIVQNNTKRVRKSTIEVNKAAIVNIKEKIKELKKLGAEFTFSELTRLYRIYKGYRDDKEEFLKISKQSKGKIYRKSNGERWSIKGHDVKRERFMLKCITHNYISWESLEYFKKDYEYCPLSNAINGGQ